MVLSLLTYICMCNLTKKPNPLVVVTSKVLFRFNHGLTRMAQLVFGTQNWGSRLWHIGTYGVNCREREYKGEDSF